MSVTLCIVAKGYILQQVSEQVNRTNTTAQLSTPDTDPEHSPLQNIQLSTIGYFSATAKFLVLLCCLPIKEHDRSTVNFMQLQAYFLLSTCLKAIHELSSNVAYFVVIRCEHVALTDHCDQHDA